MWWHLRGQSHSPEQEVSVLTGNSQCMTVVERDQNHQIEAERELQEFVRTAQSLSSSLSSGELPWAGWLCKQQHILPGSWVKLCQGRCAGLMQHCLWTPALRHEVERGLFFPCSSQSLSAQALQQYCVLLGWWWGAGETSCHIGQEGWGSVGVLRPTLFQTLQIPGNVRSSMIQHQPKEKAEQQMSLSFARAASLVVQLIYSTHRRFALTKSIS